MSRMIAFFSAACLLLTIPDYTQAAGQPEMSRYREYSITWLLTADDPSRIKIGAQWLQRDGQNGSKFADLAALSLWDFTQRTRSLDPDTVAWLTRTLGNTGSRRYQPLLENVARTNPGKVAKYANESLAKLSEAAPEYVPTEDGRAQIRDSLRNQRDSEPPKEGSLADVQISTWIEDVFEKLGYPSDINISRRSRIAPFIGHIYVDNLVLVYDDLGTVEFDHDRGDWYVTATRPRLTVRTEVAGTDSDDLVQGILSSNEPLFREVARRAAQMNVSDVATLDAAALRLRTDMRTDDPKLADGLAYLCVILSNSGNATYRDLLAEVSRNATRNSLRKHAAKALEKLVENNKKPPAILSTPAPVT